MNTVGVIGAGQMGQGIAQLFAMNGYFVYLVDASSRSLEHARINIENSCKKLIQKEQIPQQDYMKNIVFTFNLEEVQDCNIIIEAIPENLYFKKDLFSSLEAIMGDSPYILCSNTSALSLQELSKGLKNPQNFLGLHFMNPPVLIPIVEIIVTEHTHEDTLKTIKDVVQSIKKEYVLCKNSPGFIVNRLLIPMINEACLMLDQNVATVEDIDKAMKFGANFPMGPFTLADFIGLDTVLSIMYTLQKDDPRFKISRILLDLVQKGKLGKKAGAGFYKYPHRMSS